jgi:hypothetical protein
MLYFLEASVPLTKSYTMRSGELVKTPYPMTWEFTSHKHECNDLPTLERLLKMHAAKGHCMIKGELKRDLVRESRAGMTDSQAPTQLLCLDLDGLPEMMETVTPSGQVVTTPLTLDLFLREMGLHDISYVIQWSASYGIVDKRLRAHLFMYLDKPTAAPLLKQWLIQKNHEVPLLRNATELIKTGNALRWPLDISACQNDKLIYIAPPVLRGIKDPMGKQPRIQLVKHKYDVLSIATTIQSTEKNKQLTHARVNELRDAAGLPSRRFSYKVVGGQEVMLKPDEAVITEKKTERGFVYFNLNGGDSWAYYHPEDNPKYIFNFKGEPTYLTAELLPEYWAELQQTPTQSTSNGVTRLAFCDRRTGTYWRGTYIEAEDELEIYQAKNETQLRDFCKQHGVPIGDFVPEWDLVFDPHDNVRVDVANRTVNRFQPSKYMKAAVKPTPKCPPTIYKVVSHALGGDPNIIDHFMNWIAFILQNRDRTKTAWVLHGTQGCLAPETQIEFKRGKRNAGRALTIKEAYEKWTEQYKLGTGRGKAWNLKHTTFAKSVRDGMTIGFHEVFNIVQSGEKQLYRLTTTSGRSIRATELHPFMRPDGSFTPLHKLQPGDEVVMEGLPINTKYRGGRDKKRATIHSIPFHPYAWKHVVDGKNYKRLHRARLVVEAAMNNMALDDFVQVLRTDETRAQQLRYLRDDEVVHHRDEDPSNDDLQNLEIIDKANHDAHHAKEVGMGYLSTQVAKIKSIKKDKTEMTYDMVMKAPYHNYVANGFVVHNTGKGILTNNVLRPLFGTHTATRRMEELNEKYNHFMQDSLLVFVDEVQIKALGNERGVMAKLKNFITEELVPIRAMHANAVEARNHTNWIFMSNMPDPIIIDRTDRRFNVGGYQAQKLQITDQELARIVNELQSFHDYLMTYKVDATRARMVVQSEDRNNLIAVGEQAADQVSEALLSGNFEFFLDQLPTSTSRHLVGLQRNRLDEYTTALKTLMLRTRPDGKCNITRDELRTLYDYTVGNMPDSPNKFTALLKHHRIHTTRVWVDKTVHGIAVVWKDASKFSQYQKQHFPEPQPKAKTKTKAKARA